MLMYEPPLGQLAFGNKWEEGIPPHNASDLLYELSKALAERDPENQHHGLLGGEYGYGQDFENGTFEMHPYYWGACECGADEVGHAWWEVHPHSAECWQTVYYKIDESTGKPWRDNVKQLEEAKRRYGLTSDKGIAVLCTCGIDEQARKEIPDHAATCRIVLPNFHFKPTGFTLYWYKYIGRGMACSVPISGATFKKMIRECLQSLEADA